MSQKPITKFMNKLATPPRNKLKNKRQSSPKTNEKSPTRPILKGAKTAPPTQHTSMQISDNPLDVIMKNTPAQTNQPAGITPNTAKKFVTIQEPATTDEIPAPDEISEETHPPTTSDTQDTNKHTDSRSLQMTVHVGAIDAKAPVNLNCNQNNNQNTQLLPEHSTVTAITTSSIPSPGKLETSNSKTATEKGYESFKPLCTQLRIEEQRRAEEQAHIKALGVQLRIEAQAEKARKLALANGDEASLPKKDIEKPKTPPDNRQPETPGLHDPNKQNYRTYYLDETQPVNKHYYHIISKADPNKLKPFSPGEIRLDTANPQFAKRINVWTTSPWGIRNNLDFAPDKFDVDIFQELCKETYAKTSSTDIYAKGTSDRQMSSRLLAQFAKTPPSNAPSWDASTGQFLNPTVLEKCIYVMHKYMGPIHSYAETEKKRAKIKKDKAANKYTRIKPLQSKRTYNTPEETEKPPAGKPRYATYFDITTPSHAPIPEDDGWKTSNKIAASHVTSLLEQLFDLHADTKISLYPGAKTPGRAWLHHHSPTTFLPKDKRSCGNYLFRIWYNNSGDSPQSPGRVLILHNTPVETILEAFKPTNNWEECCEDKTSMAFTLTKSKIQSSSITRFCWLHGTTKHTNPDNLIASLLTTPVFANNPPVEMSAAFSVIQRFQGEKVPFDERVSALHFSCATSEVAVVSTRLMQAYQEKKKSNFAQSKKFHFVPDQSSPMCLTRSDEEHKALYETCTMEQREICDNTCVIELLNVITDPTEPLMGKNDKSTLYDAFMGIRDPDDPTKPLFQGLDQDRTNPNLWFAQISSDRYDEAYDVIQRLGLALAHKLGPRVWAAWFTDEYHQQQKLQFPYSTKEARYISTQESQLKSLENHLLSDKYNIEPTTEIKKCHISNLILKMPGPYKVPSVGSSVINKDGTSVASSTHNQANDFSTLGSHDSLDDAMLESDDEEEEPEIMEHIILPPEGNSAEPHSTQLRCPTLVSMHGLLEEMEKDPPTFENDDAKIDAGTVFTAWHKVQDRKLRKDKKIHQTPREKQKNFILNLVEMGGDRTLQEICRRKPSLLSYQELVIQGSLDLVRLMPAIPTHSPIVYVAPIRPFINELDKAELFLLHEAFNATWMASHQHTPDNPLLFEYLLQETLTTGGKQTGSLVQRFQTTLTLHNSGTYRDLAETLLTTSGEQHKTIDLEYSTNGPTHHPALLMTHHLALPPIVTMTQIVEALEPPELPPDECDHLKHWIRRFDPASLQPFDTADAFEIISKLITLFEIPAEQFVDMVQDDLFHHVLHRASVNYPCTLPPSSSTTHPYLVLYDMQDTHEKYRMVMKHIRETWLAKDPRIGTSSQAVGLYILEAIPADMDEATTYLNSHIAAGFTTLVQSIKQATADQHDLCGEDHDFYHTPSLAGKLDGTPHLTEDSDEDQDDGNNTADNPGEPPQIHHGNSGTHISEVLANPAGTIPPTDSHTPDPHQEEAEQNPADNDDDLEYHEDDDTHIIQQLDDTDFHDENLGASPVQSISSANSETSDQHDEYDNPPQTANFPPDKEEGSNA